MKKAVAISAMILVGAAVVLASLGHAAAQSATAPPKNTAPTTQSTPAKAPSAASAAQNKTAVAASVIPEMNKENIRAHVRFLSHDLLEGRGTGQRGGDIAAE